MTKRDPATGRFLSNPGSALKPRKSRKKATPKTPKTQKRKGGRFVKDEDALNWQGGKIRKDYILRDRFDPIKGTLAEMQKDHQSVSPDRILELFAQLSSNENFALTVTFIFMPGYQQADDSDGFIPQYCVYIGSGLEFITKINGWIGDEFVIGKIEASQLSEADFKPTSAHPLWSGDSVETVDGVIHGSGFRAHIENDNWRKYRQRDPYDRTPKPKKPRDYKREKEMAKIIAEAKGTKRNRGDRAAQQRRYRARLKEKKNGEKENT